MLGRASLLALGAAVLRAGATTLDRGVLGEQFCDPVVGIPAGPVQSDIVDVLRSEHGLTYCEQDNLVQTRIAKYIVAVAGSDPNAGDLATPFTDFDKSPTDYLKIVHASSLAVVLASVFFYLVYYWWIRKDDVEGIRKNKNFLDALSAIKEKKDVKWGARDMRDAGIAISGFLALLLSAVVRNAPAKALWVDANVALALMMLIPLAFATGALARLWARMQCTSLMNDGRPEEAGQIKFGAGLMARNQVVVVLLAAWQLSDMYASVSSESQNLLIAVTVLSFVYALLPIASIIFTLTFDRGLTGNYEEVARLNGRGEESQRHAYTKLLSTRDPRVVMSENLISVVNLTLLLVFISRMNEVPTTFFHLADKYDPIRLSTYGLFLVSVIQYFATLLMLFFAKPTFNSQPESHAKATSL